MDALHTLFNGVSCFPMDDEEWLGAIRGECRELEKERPEFLRCAMIFRKVVGKRSNGPYHNDTLSQECSVVRLLGQEGEAVPKVTHIGRGAPFFNMERLPGITLHSLMQLGGYLWSEIDINWHEETRLSVARGIGEVMGGASRILAGRKLRSINKKSSFHIPGMEDVQSARARIGPEAARMCERIIGDCEERVGAAGEAVFHGDINNGNLMVKEGSSAPVFSGAIDWEMLERGKPACFFSGLSPRFSAEFIQEAAAAYAGKTGCDLKSGDMQLVDVVRDEVTPLLRGDDPDAVNLRHRLRLSYNRIYNPGGPKY